MPFVTYFMDSGQLNTSSRIKDAVFMLFYYTALVMILPGALFYYLITSGKIKEEDTPRFVIAVTNS